MSIKSQNRFLSAPIFGLLLLVLFSAINVDYAANACTSTGTGNWSVSGTWTSCGGGIPTSADSVTILTGHIVTVDTTAVADTVTINANAGAGGNGININSGMSLTVTGAVTLNIPTAATTDLNVDGGSLTAGSIAIPGGAANRFATVSVSTGTVTVAGSITFSGTAARARYVSTGASTTNIGGDFGVGGTLTTSGTGTINFNGPVAQLIGAYATYNNVQINNTGGDVTFSGTTTIGGTLVVNTGTLNMGGVSPTVIGATTINSILRISSVTGTKTFGDITIASGGILNFTAAEVITHLGNLVVDGTGTITGTTGVWAFRKVGGGSISGTASSIAITSATFTTSYTSSIPTTYSGTVTITGGAIVLTNNSTITVSASLAGTGKLTQGVSSILNIGGTSAITGLDASASPNDVHYTSTTANQTINAAASVYHNLFIDKSGRVATLAAVATINGNLSVTAGTLADGGFQIIGNATGSFTLASGTTLTLGTTLAATAFPTTFTALNITLATTSTVTYNSNLAQNVSNIVNYGNLTTTATSSVTKTAQGNLTVVGAFTNGANNIFADAGFTITLNDGAVMSGTHTGTGKMLFTGGSVAHSVAGAGSFNNVELDDSNGVTQSVATNIGGTFTIISGIWTASNTLSVTGQTSVSGILRINSATGTKTFGDITINTGGTMSLITAIETITINGNMLINTGGVMSFSVADIIALSGNLTVNGTAVISGSTGLWTFQKVGGGTIGGTTPSLTILGSTTFATQYSILIPYTSNTFTVSAGVNEINLSTITVNTALAGAGTFTQSTGAVLNLGGSVTITTLAASTSPNDVHYTSTTAGQTVKATNYYNLFLDKLGQTATMTGTTNILGNLTLSAGTISLQTSTVTVTGTTDIHGSLRDVNDTGFATFGGLVTVHPSGSWDCISAENAPFNFSNGLVFDGGSFDSGPGLYTFQNNNQSITGSSNITIDNLVVTGIQLTNSSLAELTSVASLSGTGEFIQDTNAVLNISGVSPITTLTASASDNIVNYIGTAPQIVHSGIYQELNVDENASNSVDITADTTVNTVLNLGSTKLSTSSNKIIIGPVGSLIRTSGYIVGNLQKNISVGATTRTFEIGSASDYLPVDVTFSSVTTAGDLTVSTTSTDTPSISSSGLFANKTVNRYWTILNNGVIFDNYVGTFNFVPADVDIAADASNFILKKLDGVTWTKLTLGSLTSTSAQTSVLTSFSDFVVGERSIINVTSGLADGTYGVGQVIPIQIIFADIVTVTGTPLLTLNSGGTASYVSGTGTNTLLFNYTVSSGNSSADLDYSNLSSLILNGGTIQDDVATDIDLSLFNLGSAGSLGGNKAIVINTESSSNNGNSDNSGSSSSSSSGSINQPTQAISAPVEQTEQAIPALFDILSSPMVLNLGRNNVFLVAVGTFLIGSFLSFILLIVLRRNRESRILRIAKEKSEHI